MLLEAMSPRIPARQIDESGTVIQDLIRAFAWLVSNRMAREIMAAPGERFGSVRAAARLACALESVWRDLRAYGLDDTLPPFRAGEIAARVTIMGHMPIATCEDPICGAVIFYPHWIEPPDTEHLRATALIGPFVFFAVCGGGS